MRYTWLQVRGRLRGAPDCMDSVRVGNVGGGLASPTLSWVPLSFVLPLLVAEKNHLSFVYVLAMNMAIQTALFLYASGRSTDSVMDSDDRLPYFVPIVGLTVTLQSTR